MKNKKYVDKLPGDFYHTDVFQQKKWIYTHLHKKYVDNVYNFNHSKKSLKYKACHDL